MLSRTYSLRSVKGSLPQDRDEADIGEHLVISCTKFTSSLKYGGHARKESISGLANGGRTVTGLSKIRYEMAQALLVND